MFRVISFLLSSFSLPCGGLAAAFEEPLIYLLVSLTVSLFAWHDGMFGERVLS